MDDQNRPQRSAKRRRLDHELKSPGAAKIGTNPTRAKTREKAARKDDNDDDNDDAVAAAPSYTSAQADVDVYDDIDGAHTARRGAERNTSTTRKSKQFNPLRNQKSPAAAAAAAAVTTTSPTPGNTPSKGAIALGFFKQFHSSPGEQRGSPSKLLEDREVIEKSRGRRRGGPKDINGGHRGLSERGSGDEEEEVTSVRSSSRARRLPARYDDSRNGTPLRSEKGTPKSQKRTFKDKIQDLKQMTEKKKKEMDPRVDGGQQSSEKEQQDGEISHENEVVPMNIDVGRSEKLSAPIPKRAKKSQARRKPIAHEGSLKKVHSPEAALAPSSPIPQRSSLTVDQRPILAKSISVAKASSNTQDATFTAQQLQMIQGRLLGRFTGSNSIPLTHLENEYAKVSSLVEQTITAGESNSMLVMGARGSGKSTMINQILQEQSSAHPGDFHVVRLNGFIHTDDKLAVREIWRQLGRDTDMDGEESNGPTKNIADTMTTLLALLSDPAEQGREHESGRITKSVIFILDEFELFASHPRQTLLYNLFDVAQSRKAPIAVLGLTARIDVAEALEKRVKSRFSHRYVHLSLLKSFSGFQDSCRASLLLSTDDINTANGGVDQSLVDNWNAFVDQLLSLEPFEQHLQRLYHTTKSIPAFLTSLWMPVSTMPVTTSQTATSILIQHFASALQTLQPPDSKLTLLASLSTLHLALLICAARLTAIHGVDAISFAETYEEYKTLTSKAKIQASAAGALAQGAGARMWGKDVSRNVWQELEQLGLVIADTGSANAKGRVDVGLEEIGMSGVELGAWSKWCKEI